MLIKKSIKIMLDGSFRKYEVTFGYAILINEDGKRIMLILGVGAEGRFETRMGGDCVLWCKMLGGEWRSIDECRFVGNGESEEEQ